MNARFRIASALAAAVATLPATAQTAVDQTLDSRTASARPGTTKEGTVGAQLLLPLYLVDTANPGGPTTLYSVRNESTSAVDVVVRYFGADRPDQPQDEQTFTLGAKAMRTVNIFFEVPALDLQIDPDGFARGYVTFATTQDEAVIHGDYFQLNAAQNFASGARLLNIDPNSNGNDLCNRFSMRFIDSTLFFDSGTVFTVWFEAAGPFSGNAFTYSVYSEAGGNELLSSNFPTSVVAFQVSANLLMSADPGLDLEFGALEFQFPGETVGHISAVMDAFDRYSVGYEATCLDPT